MYSKLVTEWPPKIPNILFLWLSHFTLKIWFLILITISIFAEINNSVLNNNFENGTSKIFPLKYTSLQVPRNSEIQEEVQQTNGSARRFGRSATTRCRDRLCLLAALSVHIGRTMMVIINIIYLFFTISYLRIQRYFE